MVTHDRPAGVAKPIIDYYKTNIDYEKNEFNIPILILRFCALKLIFKLISGKECIADSAPSFELVRRRAIFTAKSP